MLSISAGFGHGGKDYWIWFTLSGSYPGFSWGGRYFPLNQDPLFWFGIQNPNFGGSTGFVGKLAGSGTAVATLALPKDPSMSLVGYPIHFAYVLFAGGLKPPPDMVSNPVHVKYVP